MPSLSVRSVSDDWSLALDSSGRGAMRSSAYETGGRLVRSGPRPLTVGALEKDVRLSWPNVPLQRQRGCLQLTQRTLASSALYAARLFCTLMSAHTGALSRDTPRFSAMLGCD